MGIYRSRERGLLASATTICAVSVVATAWQYLLVGDLAWAWMFSPAGGAGCLGPDTIRQEPNPVVPPFQELERQQKKNKKV